MDEALRDTGIQLPDAVTVVHPDEHPHRNDYLRALWTERQRKGMTERDASAWLRNRNAFGMAMVKAGDADGLVTGLYFNYGESVRHALQIVGPKPGVGTVSGLYLLVMPDRLLFLADCTVNVDPSARQLADIARNTAQVVRTFGVTPRVAMLSFSSFGSTRTAQSDKVAAAVGILRKEGADFEFDGEIQADVAFDAALRREVFPFSTLTEDANVLVFPDLGSANIAYKLLTKLAGATAIGPLLVGMKQPVNVLQLGSDVSTIENLAIITAVEAAIGTY
jgi:malate dehydrogenase (oxaloacetate-decarboxylating)(NADP+)